MSEENLELKVEKLSADAILPTRGTEQSVGLDLYRYDYS